MTSLLFFGLLIGIVLLWLDGARARELAIGIARALCARSGLQLLDETVTRSRIGLRWTSQGIRLRRMFHFDVSYAGVERLQGHLILLGTQLESAQLPRIPGEGEEPPAFDIPEPARQNGVVVPFRHPRR